MAQTQNMATMPLRRGHFRILIVSSMEQIIGAGLSTVVGIMLPMIIMLKHPELSSVMQGIVGALGLIGIAIGSAVIGRLSDKMGYLLWFRLCPVLIMAGSAIVYFFPDVPGLIIGLLLAGFGVGGGYSLDSSYISELMPDKWKLFMVGVAKGTSALGFLGVAVVCVIILHHNPSPHIWNALIWIIGVLGLLTFLMRLSWRQSPHWLLLHGENEKAEEAVKYFLGNDVVITPSPTAKPASAPVSWFDMFRGEHLKKVILTGIPWACEGMGVYGFGVFLPVLIMALGIDSAGEHATGIAHIMNSIDLTAVVNFFILPGFIIGLLVVNKRSHISMMTKGFLACSLGLILLLVAYLTKMPAWVSIVGFVIFEVFLNAGPHLVTYILPSQVFPVEVRAAGSGIAAMLGKVGAVVGVIIMPLMLKWGGMILVLSVSIAVMLLGALIGQIYGKKLGVK